MITVQTTHRLFSALPLGNDSRLDAPAHLSDDTTTLLDHWHVKPIDLDFEPALLFVHNLTRFPVLIPDIELLGYDQLETLFYDIFIGSLIRLGADEAQLHRAASAIGAMQFVCSTNRSVLGTMNRCAQELRWFERGSDPTEVVGSRLSATLADFAYCYKGRKGYIIPGLEMLMRLGMQESLAEDRIVASHCAGEADRRLMTQSIPDKSNPSEVVIPFPLERARCKAKR